jgi:predicted translin family RNA/ssDNA-binding protein
MGFNGEERRPDAFLRKAEAIFRHAVKAPEGDFGMYQAMDNACDGLHGYLDELRRNQGRVGYSAQNDMSDYSKEYIDAIMDGREDDAMYLWRQMDVVAKGINEAGCREDLAEMGTRFSRTIWQEKLEAELFGKIWPVVTGKKEEVPNLPHWDEDDFQGNIQAFLYGFLDVVSELSKALTEELGKPDITTKHEFALYERYLKVAKSITLRLSAERHVPGYVISNGYGRWMAFSNKLRGAYGCIAHVQRDFNLRRSILRMVKSVHAAETAKF